LYYYVTGEPRESGARRFFYRARLQIDIYNHKPV